MMVIIVNITNSFEKKIIFSDGQSTKS